MCVADQLRKESTPKNIVTWQIDRNVNTTNACIANCKFCNFFRPPRHKDVYVTSIDTYKKKIYVYGIAQSKDEQKEVIKEYLYEQESYLLSVTKI